MKRDEAISRLRRHEAELTRDSIHKALRQKIEAAAVPAF